MTPKMANNLSSAIKQATNILGIEKAKTTAIVSAVIDLYPDLMADHIDQYRILKDLVDKGFCADIMNCSTKTKAKLCCEKHLAMLENFGYKKQVANNVIAAFCEGIGSKYIPEQITATNPTDSSSSATVTPPKRKPRAKKASTSQNTSSPQAKPVSPQPTPLPPAPQPYLEPVSKPARKKNTSIRPSSTTKKKVKQKIPTKYLLVWLISFLVMWGSLFVFDSMFSSDVWKIILPLVSLAIFVSLNIVGFKIEDDEMRKQYFGIKTSIFVLIIVISFVYGLAFKITTPISTHGFAFYLGLILALIVYPLCFFVVLSNEPNRITFIMLGVEIVAIVIFFAIGFYPKSLINILNAST